MAGLPVPGSELTGVSPEATIAAAIPPPVHDVLRALWANGHAAYVVGGSLRDALLGRDAKDWDLASDARPERVLELLPDAVYENQFGTVAIRRGDDVFEITTFRSDHDYADFRRPHRVEFGATIDVDLARRDLTCNAMAWGAKGAATGARGPGGADTPGPGAKDPGAPTGPGAKDPGADTPGPAANLGRPGPDTPGPAANASGPDTPGLVDPYDGAGDTLAHVLRAVGDPRKRFEEDALRMVRTVRLAAVLGFGVEAATLAGIQARADLVRHLSGERIAAELDRLLAAERPSIGLRLLADTGLLTWISPELAAQRGIPQNKTEGEDLWDHTLRTVDAAPTSRPIVRLAALVHDIGKPATFADDHFIGHDMVGADVADALLERLRAPRASRERVVHLVRNHMFSYEIHWSSSAVRRFIAKIGRDAIDELFALREADNLGSGLPASAGRLDELRRRVDEALREGVAFGREDLAIDGNDLLTEFGVEPGPRLGRVLEALLDRVQDDPALNDRPSLLLLAQGMLGEEP